MSTRKRSSQLTETNYQRLDALVSKGEYATLDDALNVVVALAYRAGLFESQTVPTSPDPTQKSEVLPVVQQKSEVPPTTTPVPLGTSAPARQGGIDALRSLGKK